MTALTSSCGVTRLKFIFIIINVNCASQIHGKGLKFGIYGDIGTNTCAGYPGNAYHLQLDAETYANWTVDYFKMDGCNWDTKQYDEG